MKRKLLILCCLYGLFLFAWLFRWFDGFPVRWADWSTAATG